MKLKSFFFILAFLLLVVWIILLFIATQENGWRFYLIESIITFSLIYLLYFYRKVIKPLNSIAGGMDLLQAQDFSNGRCYQSCQGIQCRVPQSRKHQSIT